MNEKNPTLCIVAGPNGSGKTSTTVQLLHNEWAENSLYINPDNIAQEQYGDWNSPVAVLKNWRLKCVMSV
jgi:predicted ABC-type ATPase